MHHISEEQYQQHLDEEFFLPPTRNLIEDEENERENDFHSRGGGKEYLFPPPTTFEEWLEQRYFAGLLRSEEGIESIAEEHTYVALEQLVVDSSNVEESCYLINFELNLRPNRIMEESVTGKHSSPPPSSSSSPSYY